MTGLPAWDCIYGRRSGSACVLIVRHGSSVFRLLRWRFAFGWRWL